MAENIGSSGSESGAEAAPSDVRERTRIQLKYIYDAYRNAALNRAYYGERLMRFQKYNSWIEIAIALGATGSGGVAGLAIWGTITGAYAWLLISGVATVLGVVKPVLQWGKVIENYSKLYTGHTNIYLELKALVEDIDVNRNVSEKLKEKYSSSRQLLKELGALDDPKPDNALIKELQQRINREIPPEALWMPS